MDSSEERFKKRTARGKYLRQLRDDTEDLRREAMALEIDFSRTGDSDEDTNINTATADIADEVVAPPKTVSNPFGTLRNKRRRNVRLLAEINGDSPAASPASSSPALLVTPTKKPKKSVKNVAAGPGSEPKRAKSSAGKESRKMSEPEPVHRTDEAPLSVVQANLARLELADARAKQHELESRLAKLSTEKSAKEAELAHALTRIKELERSKNAKGANAELESTQMTARNLQKSIEAYKQESANLARLREAVKEELKARNGGVSASTTTDESDTDSASPRAIASSQPDETDFTQVDASQAEAALEERKKRTISKKSAAASKGAKRSSSSKPAANATKSASGGTASPSRAPKKSSGELKPKRSKPALESHPDLPTFDAVVWFKAHYTAACNELGVAAIEDLLMVLDRASSKSRPVIELDLNNYSLGTSDILALTKAFRATGTEIAKVSPSQITLAFQPPALDLSHNQIGSGLAIVDLMSAIGKVLAIDVGFNNWGPKATLEFAEELNNYPHLTTLRCSQNLMGPKAGAALIKALMNASTSLSILDLSNNALDDRVAVPLAALIQACPLTTLSIKYNKFKTSGMKKIAAAIGQNQTLTDLDLTSCGIGEKSKEIVEILESRENITKLCIGFNKLPSNFVPRFTSFSAKQKNLVHLDLRGLELPSKAIRQVIDAVSVNVSGTLQELILNGNALDSKCMELLIDYITRTQLLHSLGLRGCGVPKAPLIELLATIKHSTTLKAVDLSGNSFNDRRILEALGSCLQNNTSLTMFGIAACKLDAKSIGPIGQALQFNQSLEKLHIDGQKLTERGLMEFAAGLAGNEVLKVLSIQATCITARGLLSFLAAITAKTQVEVVDAAENALPVTNKMFKERIDQFDAIAVKL